MKSEDPEVGKTGGVQPDARKTVFSVIPGVMVKVEPSLFFKVPMMFAAEYFKTYAPSTGVRVAPEKFASAYIV